MFASRFKGARHLHMRCAHRGVLSTFAVPDLARLMRCAHRGVLSPPARAGSPCVRPGPRPKVHKAESFAATRKGRRVTWTRWLTRLRALLPCTQPKHACQGLFFLQPAQQSRPLRPGQPFGVGQGTELRLATPSQPKPNFTVQFVFNLRDKWPRQ